MFRNSINEITRQAWLRARLTELPAGIRILDAGAGELQNRQYCGHLNYVSQDLCQYKGVEEGAISEGLQTKTWNTSLIDLVSDITQIPAPDASFDVILCSEVLEHVPEPTLALNEFSRLLKVGGTLILTAPFGSNVHMAPYHFCTGFSKFWYKHHMEKRGFKITELTANGDWFSLLHQEIKRLGSMERQHGSQFWLVAYIYSMVGNIYFKLRADRRAEDLACFGWHCVAIKES